MVYIPTKRGKQAEDFACCYLKSKGLNLIARNYTCRLGEIDLIMHDKDMLVFIEVRYRQHQQYGHSLETVDAGKKNKLIKTAEHYLQYNPKLAEIPCRFDVFGISPGKSNVVQDTASSLDYDAQVEWIKNAFF